MLTEHDALVEQVARIIDPSSWRVMDSYLEQTKRKYRGQNVGWPVEQYQDKASMAKARQILSIIRTTDAARIAELKSENDRLLDVLFDAVALIGHVVPMDTTALIGGERLVARDVWQAGHDLMFPKSATLKEQRP